MTFQLFSEKMLKFYLGIFKKKMRTKMLEGRQIRHRTILNVNHIISNRYFNQFHRVVVTGQSLNELENGPSSYRHKMQLYLKKLST